MILFYSQLDKLKLDFKKSPSVGWSHFWTKLNELLSNIRSEFENNILFFNSFTDPYYPYFYFDGAFLASVSKIAKSESKRQGLEILADVDTELQHVEISHLRCKDNLILAIFHIPTVVRKDQVSVYRAFPVYAPIPSNHKLSKGPNSFMTAQADHYLFFISSDKKQFTIMATDSVIHCHKFMNQNFCSGVPDLKPEPESSCLGSLFFGLSDIARNLCAFGTGTDKAVHSYQLTSTDYIFMSHHFIQTPIHCSFAQHLDSPTVTINQTTKVSIPQGCGIELPTRSVWSSWNFKTLPNKVSSVKLDLNSFLAQDYLKWIEQYHNMLLSMACKIPLMFLYAIAFGYLCVVDDSFKKLIPFILFIHNLNFVQLQESKVV